MATERVLIGESHFREAVKLAKSGDDFDGKQIVFSDTRAVGLRLIVQKDFATWFVKYKNWTKAIGYAHPDGLRPIVSASAARDFVATIKALLDEDPAQVEPFLVARHAGRNNEDAIVEMRAVMRPVVTTWTLRECFEHLITARTKPTAKKKIGKLYIEELCRSMARPALSKYIDQPAVLLTRGDLEGIRDEVEATSGVSPSLKTLSNVRNVMSYCAQQQSALSGLDPRYEWWQLVVSDSHVKPRTRKPTLADIGKTISLATEYLHKPLPGRQDYKHGVRDNVYAAFCWLTMTCQRVEAALSIRRCDFYPDEREPGWYLATWGEGVMKAGVAHVLPLPPRAVAFILPLIQAARRTESDWSFPSERGTDEKDIHVNRSAPLAVVRRLAAKDAMAREATKAYDKAVAYKAGRATLAALKARKDAFVDILTENDIAYWTPHDLRRSLVECMDDAGIPGGASAILAHELTLTDGLGEEALSSVQMAQWKAQRVAKITKMAYGKPVHLDLKKKAMLAWTTVVLDQLDGRV